MRVAAMTLHAKGYLTPLPLLLLLLLLLLPALVVSRNPRQLSRSSNEASSTTTATRTTSTTARATLPSFDLLPPTSWAERQAAGGLQIGSRALIARPEKRSVPGGAPSISGKQMTMVVRKVRAGTEGYLAVAKARLHQQSTNSAAAKRDLQYNKQRIARGTDLGEQPTQAISGYFIPEMYQGQIDRLQQEQLEGQFLPDAINALGSYDDPRLYNDKDEIKRERCNGFLSPRIIYVGQALPEPFVQLYSQRRSRVSGLSNFLIKGRPSVETRSFEDESDLSIATTEGSNAADAAQATEAAPSIDQPSEPSNLPPSTTISPHPVSSTVPHHTSDSIKEEDSFALEEDGDSTTVPSFEANFAEDDELTTLMTTRMTPKVAEYRDNGPEDFNVPDWDVSESQKREVQHDSEVEASLAKSRSKEGDHPSIVEENGSSGSGSGRSVYEFGYRVIDHATGSDFGHSESRRLGRETEGRYHVLLPDGRLQRVEYSVGSDTGFRASVYFGSAADGTVEDTREQAVALSSSSITNLALGAPVALTKVTDDTPVAAADVSSSQMMVIAKVTKSDETMEELTTERMPEAMTGLTKLRSPVERTQEETEVEAEGATTLDVTTMARQTTPKE